jgi:hypothetical protein
MNYKIIANLRANFELDSRHEIWHVERDSSGKELRRVPVTNPMDKGYIYAALYFFDDIKREVEKLEKMVRKIRDEIGMESPSLESPIKMLYVSRRVRDITGDDSLDALIKEMLAEEKGKHIALVPEKGELAKYEKVKNAIFTELLSEFTEQTLGNTIQNEGGKCQFSLKPKYIETMTETQKAIFVPAVKMAAFLFGLRLNDFQLMPNFTVSYNAQKLPEPFAAQEEEIKKSIKKLIAG